MDKVKLPSGLEFEYCHWWSGIFEYYPIVPKCPCSEKSINTFKENPVEITITGNLENFTLSSIYDE